MLFIIKFTDFFGFYHFNKTIFMVLFIFSVFFCCLHKSVDSEIVRINNNIFLIGVIYCLRKCISGSFHAKICIENRVDQKTLKLYILHLFLFFYIHTLASKFTVIMLRI